MNTHASNTGPTFSRRGAVGSMSNMETSVLKCAGYIRVSTDMQAEYGVSLDAQKDAIRRYCAMMGYQLVDIFVDQQSAKNTDRPDFIRMFKRVDDGQIGAIIVTKLDRFSRSQRDFYDFIENYVNVGKAHLICIAEGINTTQPATKMVLPILIAVGQIERNQTSERVKTSIAYIRQQGGHYGKVPFGYQTVGEGRIKKLEPHPEEHPWLERIFAWYRDGKQHTEIARLLNEHGVKPKQKDKWTLQMVYDLLVRHGIHKPRSVQNELVYDRHRAYSIAYQLRSEERTLSFIAEHLTKQGLRPRCGQRYQWYSVQDLLRSATYHDRATPQGCARFWKEQGLSLREICLKLKEQGHSPKRGGMWYPQTVKMLLVS